MEKCKLDVSVIIPTMNRVESLKKTINRMLSCKFIPGQIIVVDQTEKIKIRQEIFSYIENMKKIVEITYEYQSNPSSTKARNKGISLSKYEIVIFSDDDVEVKDNNIKNVFDIMSNKEDIAMIGGLDKNSDIGGKRGYLIGTKSLLKRKKGHVTKAIFGRYPDVIPETTTTEWAMGYFFCVKKSLLEEGKIKFDERLIKYAYAEDLDFSYRYNNFCKKYGMKSILTKEVMVRHLVSKEYRITNELQTYMFLANRRYLYAKFYGMRSIPILMTWANFCFLLDKVLKREEPITYLKCWMKVLILKKDIINGNMHYDLIA